MSFVFSHPLVIVGLNAPMNWLWCRNFVLQCLHNLHEFGIQSKLDILESVTSSARVGLGFILICFLEIFVCANSGSCFFAYCPTIWLVHFFRDFKRVTADRFTEKIKKSFRNWNGGLSHWRDIQLSGSPLVKLFSVVSSLSFASACLHSRSPTRLVAELMYWCIPLLFAHRVGVLPSQVLFLLKATLKAESPYLRKLPTEVFFSILC